MFRFKKQSQAILGLEFLSEGVAVAVNNSLKEGEPPEIAFLEGKGIGEQAALLKEWVGKKNLEKSQANVVLGASCYQMLLLESPDVAEEEVREAMRWRIKDLLTIPVEDAVLDVFPLPEDGIRGNKKMVYVVAASRQLIEETINASKHSGLALNAIDIVEMSMRNVAYSLIAEDQSVRGVAIARLAQGSGSVFLYKRGNMYLARNFTLDYNAGLMDDIPQEALALELQRSVDYYERQMGQAPPSRIFICGDNVLENKIGDVLRSSFSVPVDYLSPVVAQEDDEDESLLQICVGAMGASLRDQVVINAAD